MQGSHNGSLHLARARRSHDVYTPCACLVAGPDHEERTTGFNGRRRELDDSKTERLERPEKHHWMEHAKRNAIYKAARIGVSLSGCSMYMLSRGTSTMCNCSAGEERIR